MPQDFEQDFESDDQMSEKRIEEMVGNLQDLLGKLQGASSATTADSEIVKQVIEEYLKKAEDYKPLVEKLIDVIESYGPQFKRLFSGIALGSIAVKADAVCYLVHERNFTTEQAIVMVSEQWSSVTQAMRHAQNNMQTKKS